MYDPLFMALAQAESQPSKALRATESGANAMGSILGGYVGGRQLQSQLEQPAALAQIYGATPQGQAVQQQLGPYASQIMTRGMYGMPASNALDWMGKQSQLTQQGNIAQANTLERATASANHEITLNSIFGGTDLTKRIQIHENAIQSLNNNNQKIVSSFPQGLWGGVQSWMNNPSNGLPTLLQNPQYTASLSKLTQNNSDIKSHKDALTSLYQGMGQLNSQATQAYNSGALNNDEGTSGGNGDNTDTSGVSTF